MPAKQRRWDYDDFEDDRPRPVRRKRKQGVPPNWMPYIETNNGWLVAGVTSRQTKDSLRPCGDGGIYARLHVFEDWIKGGNLAPLSSADDAITVDHVARNRAATLLPQIALKAS